MLPAATASLSFSLRLQAAQGKHVGAAAVANVKLDPLASSTREIDCLGTVMGPLRDYYTNATGALTSSIASLSMGGHCRCGAVRV